MNETKVLTYVRQAIDTKALEQMYATGRPSGVTAADVERQFQIYRSNASALLNQLVKKGQLVKIDSRPVYFLPVEVLRARLGNSLQESYTPEEFLSALAPDRAAEGREESPFSALIGHDGSLARQIDQAKAAILYPPKGLHTLLIGESGTGKTLFARAMYNYGLERLGRDKKKFPFVEFNCSDYYHNPQLLMSHLFGHVKGAFTGADQERVGLVEKADGGILFLDEIHRLPPEGQELLFYLMDTGCYRKLGESASMRHAQVLIIGATTEDPRAVLLKTFTRRIPLTIELPPYREKSVEEKIQIIEHIFMRESTATQKGYLVSSRIVKALSAYPFPENIGQLSSEIKVLCARSFLNNVSGQDELLVAFDNLSAPVREYFIQNSQAIQTHFPSRYESDMMVAPSSRVEYSYSQLYEEKVYRSLMKHIDQYTAQGLGKQEMDEALGDEIRAYCNHILKRFYNESLHKEEMYKVVDREVVDFTMEAARDAFERLGLEMTQKNILVLAFHFKFLLERLRARKSISETEISALEHGYAAELEVAAGMVSRLEHYFQLPIPSEEQYFIAILLANMHRAPDQNRPALILVAHGASTASSMANVCNRLMDCSFVRAVDAPLEQSVQETYQNVLLEVRKAASAKGVLLLVDMGSLVTFGERLSRETGVKVRAIPNVTMLMALDLTRTLLSTDKDVDGIYSGYMEKNADTFSHSSQVEQENAVLTMCASGAGTSAAFKSMLEELLGQNGVSGVRVLSLSFQDIRDNSPQYQAIRARYRLLGCVGNVEYQMDIPFFHVSKLISREDKEYFIQFVRQAAAFDAPLPSPPAPELTVQEECRGFLAQNVMCLNPDVAVRYADRYLDAVNLEKINTNKALQLSLLLHLGFMLERNICNKKVLFDDEGAFIQRNQSLYQRLREHMHLLEDPFELSINDSEICYIMQTITQYGKRGDGTGR